MASAPNVLMATKPLPGLDQACIFAVRLAQPNVLYKPDQRNFGSTAEAQN
jgi:hypothetical protein